MSDFPVSLNLRDKKILVVGAGRIATKKIKKLLDYTSNITILASNISEELKELDLKYIEKDYVYGDMDEFHILVVAIDDLELQKEICKEAKEKRVLLSSSDYPNLNDFSFLTLIKEGDLSIGISTSGVSPSFALKLKKIFEEYIPKDSKEFLEKIKSLRKTMPKGIERMELFRNLTKEFFDRVKNN